MLQFALLAMEAAGMVVDYFSTQQQIEMGKQGAKIEQASINANIQMTRAQAEDASDNAMKQLRQTIGSQIAIQAARGNALVGGTAATLMNESTSNFNSDERIRRMNLLAKENELRASGLMSSLHETASELSLKQGFRQRAIDKIAGSSSFSGSNGTSSSSGFSHSAGIAKPGSNGGSYGMTPI